MELSLSFRGARPDAPADAALEPALQLLVAAAQAEHPEICLDEQAFAAHLGAVLAAGAGVAELSALRAADLWLALGCAQGDPRALRVFDERLLGALPRLVSRLRLDRAAIDELGQVLRERLLVGAPRPRIADYAGAGPLEAWVAAAAVRTALNLQRQAAPEARAARDQEASLPAAGLDPELGYLKSRYRRDFEQAFEEALGALPAPDRGLLKLHYLDGVTLDQLARTRNVHRATAARWLAAAREALLAGTRASLRARLRLSDREFESLLGLVRSQLLPRLESFLART
jgi:RNA polymerase sigma-70 factor (ECF subfamily)